MTHGHKLAWTREEDATNHLVILRLSGAMTDSPENYALVEGIRGELTTGARAIVLDLTAVELVTSVGVGAIAAAFSSVAKASGSLCLTTLPERVLALMKIVRLDLVIPIYASVDDARQQKAIGDWAVSPRH